MLTCSATSCNINSTVTETHQRSHLRLRPLLYLLLRSRLRCRRGVFEVWCLLRGESATLLRADERSECLNAARVFFSRTRLLVSKVCTQKVFLFPRPKSKRHNTGHIVKHSCWVLFGGVSWCFVGGLEVEVPWYETSKYAGVFNALALVDDVR